jgi:hypothetical protein
MGEIEKTSARAPDPELKDGETAVYVDTEAEKRFGMLNS